MEEHLHSRIIGQDEAIEAISKPSAAPVLGLKIPNVLLDRLLPRPTGVGKSELTSTGSFMFGSEDALSNWT